MEDAWYTCKKLYVSCKFPYFKKFNRMSIRNSYSAYADISFIHLSYNNRSVRTINSTEQSFEISAEGEREKYFETHFTFTWRTDTGPFFRFFPRARRRPFLPAGTGTFCRRGKEYTTSGPPWVRTVKSPFSTNFTLTSNTYRSGARDGINKQIFNRPYRRRAS